MQTIERELPWVQPPPSVKDHLFLGGLKCLFPASVLTGVQAVGSGHRAAVLYCTTSCLREGCCSRDMYGVLKKLTDISSGCGVVKHTDRGDWKTHNTLPLMWENMSRTIQRHSPGFSTTNHPGHYGSLKDRFWQKNATNLQTGILQ